MSAPGSGSGTARSTSVPTLPKVSDPFIDPIHVHGASSGDIGCHQLQSTGAKCIYRKPNAAYGSFYHDPRKAGEFKIATKFPLPVGNVEFSRLHGTRGHSATRLPGQPGFFRHDSLNVMNGVKAQAPRNSAHLDWTQYLLG
eukprot:TRINITY_DN32255_c0_g1_i1.p1 TRINITY_DN32255_c0_g1~~TRINITY_DN32255_c0_g1_i1.p1  ORF type:complete len:141 (-),score=6.96 TRINITY_DN32255_c0_g1_i1:30-452(-)